MMDNNFENERDKWTYIQLIAELTEDDKYGSRLIKLMDEAGATSTREVTLEQARNFYNNLLEDRVRGRGPENSSQES